MTLIFFKSKKSLAIINKKRSRHIPSTLKNVGLREGVCRFLWKNHIRANEITQNRLKCMLPCISHDLDHFHWLIILLLHKELVSSCFVWEETSKTSIYYLPYPPEIRQGLRNSKQDVQSRKDNVSFLLQIIPVMVTLWLPVPTKSFKHMPSLC